MDDSWPVGNVFIINLNENNEKNVQLLKETFEKFWCEVKIFDKPTKADIQNAAKDLSRYDFGHFKYIVIIVLDNRNKSEDVINSSDGHTIYLNSEFLNRILENSSLEFKNILFLLQINRVYPTEEDDLIYKKVQEEKQKIQEAAQKKQGKSQEIIIEKKFLYGRKKFYLYACETMDALPEYQDDLFIETFCELFAEFGDKYGIKRILIELAKLLKQRNYKGRPTMEHLKDHVFGDAMDEDDCKDYYPHLYRKRH